MPKTKPNNKEREGFEIEYKKLLKSYGPDWATFDDEAVKLGKSFIYQSIQATEERVRGEVLGHISNIERGFGKNISYEEFGKAVSQYIKKEVKQ